MTEPDDKATIARLLAKVQAQQKTIEILMDAAERRTSTAQSPLELLSQNLSLERVVQHKTEILERQGVELKKALHELQLTQARLLHAEKMESVGQLAAGIAHEINTPTQFIGSNVEFLEDAFGDIRLLVGTLESILHQLGQDSPMAAAGREAKRLLEDLDWDYLENEIPAAIRQTKEGIKRVTTIVQAMKEFSHPGNKEKAFNDLNRIIETTITVARNEWKYCAEVETQFDPGLPQVFCLADEIGQVFLNILINAAHAITGKNLPDQKKGLILISTRLDGDQVEICIEDTGTGIPEAIRQRIFDPFFTTKAVGKGTGQGLAISHDVIVKKHGGTINVVSEIDKGTIFTILLPIEAPSTATSPPRPA